MLKKTILLIILSSITIYVKAQKKDSIVYNFDTIIEYDENRKHNKKEYKRYLLIDNTNPNMHLLAYEKDSVIIIDTKGKSPKITFNTNTTKDIFVSIEEIIIDGNGGLENYSPSSSFKINPKDFKTKCRSKLQKRNDSIISSQSKIKVFVKSKTKKTNLLAINQEIHFDYDKEQIPLNIFSWYHKEISNDANSLKKGLMTYFKNRYDGDVKDEIELKLVSIKKHNLRLIVYGNTKNP